MIEVKITETEFDEKTGKVINEKMTARYTGEFARRYLKKHPDVYNSITIYDDAIDETFYNTTFYNTHEIVEVNKIE